MHNEFNPLRLLHSHRTLPRASWIGVQGNCGPPASLAMASHRIFTCYRHSTRATRGRRCFVDVRAEQVSSKVFRARESDGSAL